MIIVIKQINFHYKLIAKYLFLTVKLLHFAIWNSGMSLPIVNLFENFKYYTKVNLKCYKMGLLIFDIIVVSVMKWCHKCIYRDYKGSTKMINDLCTSSQEDLRLYFNFVFCSYSLGPNGDCRVVFKNRFLLYSVGRTFFLCCSCYNIHLYIFQC